MQAEIVTRSYKIRRFVYGVGLIDTYLFMGKLLTDNDIKLEDIEKDEMLDICISYNGKISRINYILAVRVLSGLYNAAQNGIE